MGEMPPGFRFFPTEEELLSFYLHKKLEGKGLKFDRIIPTVGIYELEPWQLPEMAGELCRGDTEQWFFFTPRQEREARGGRPSRTTGSGYWKATGSPSYVYSSDNRVVGVNKTMVFYKGKAPNGRKTKWKMNEYRAIEQVANSPFASAFPKLRHEMSLCRVYVISGCFRAFDRRPLWAETGEPMGGDAHQVDEHGAPAATQVAAEKTSSPESSHSGGGGGDQLEQPQNNLGVVNDEEPLWEWEQLDWL